METYMENILNTCMDKYMDIYMEHIYGAIYRKHMGNIYILQMYGHVYIYI